MDICIIYAMDSVDQNNEVNNFESLDLSYIDSFSKLIVIILKAVRNIDKNELLEKICDSIVIVLTKWHENTKVTFNQRPFFKLIMNLIYDISRKEY